MEALPEPNLFAFDSLRVKKFNRTVYVLDGNLTVKKDLDDTMDFIATASSMTGNQYKKIIDRKYVGFCKALWDPKMKDFYNFVRNSSNFPEQGNNKLYKISKFLHTVYSYSGTCPMVAVSLQFLPNRG